MYGAVAPRRALLRVGLTAAAVAVSAGACDSNRSSSRADAGASDASKVKADSGSVQISAVHNRCPSVSVAASPPDAPVGERITVTGSAVDPDGGSALTYSWTSAVGTFVNPSAPSTAYNCLFSGTQTLVLAVSDGQCTSQQGVTVYCRPQTGSTGTGGLTGSGGGGTGGRGAATGGSGVTGSGNRGATGGAGVIASGGAGVFGTGGAGVFGTGGATTNGTGTGGMLGTGGARTGGATGSSCTTDPTTDEGQACNTCTDQNCIADTDGCAMLDSDAKRQACWKLYCCLRANSCPEGDPLYCWCGSASTTDACYLVDGAADGPCRREFQDAADSTHAADIKTRLVDPAYPVGAAVNLAVCRRNYCSKYSDPPVNACRL